MQMMLLPFSFLLLVLPSLQPSSSSSEIINYCDPSSQPNPLSLRSDKLTVLISGYSPHRIPLLRSLALSYVSHPSVLSVLILWSNPSTPYSLLAPLLSLSHPSSKKINLLNSSASLSSRFLPRHILTRAVLITDDDVLLPSRALSLALRLSSISHHHPLLGFFARSHLFDLDSKSWIYAAASATRYSIVLTKAMLLHSRYLYAYSCDDRFRAARRYVDEARNCEDILMNFVVAMETKEGPVLVEAEGGVRDWGDPRNDDDEGKGGLSVRKEHMKRRGECIGEFHRLIGEMPLRYRYGKVVDGVGEQGLCNKTGKLVYCDQQACERVFAMSSEERGAGEREGGGGSGGSINFY